ncbi:MAG: ATP-binding protein [Anaerolineaceae bacterium]
MEKNGNSIKNIRARLLRIVLRAFAIVVGLTIVSILAITIIEINSSARQNPFYRSPSTMLLEAFYVGNSGWNNVDKLVQEVQQPGSQYPAQDWNNSIILDASNKVIIDHGNTNSPMVGKIIQIKPGDQTTEIKVNGVVVGTIINDIRDIPHPLRLTISFINPILIVSVVLAIFAVIIGILLTRRVVNPISEVMAAAEKVAAGDLSSRIKIKKGNDDLSVLVDHFNSMTEALEKNDNERRQLLADVAHELRTPLSILRGRLEGIVDGIYPVNDASIAPALEETYLLERLVEDLRLLTMAENRQLHFEMHQVDLLQSLERAVAIFSPQAQDKGIEIELYTDAPSATVWVDPQRLEQVVGNIIDNALRYVNTEKGKVAIQLEHVDGGVKVSIADNGAGLPDGEMERIFDRFWRSDKSRTRAAGGAGLGMAIVKQLVEAQGGKVGAENVPGGGLMIWFILPENAEQPL